MNMWNAYVAPVRVMSDLVKCVARATSDVGAFIQSPIRTRQRKMNHVETEEQFKTAIAADQITVASFSAPWCGSCKQMKPKVEALATELSQATFLKLDAEELEELLEEIEVESFPHFRVYKSGELLAEYTGTKFEKVEEFIRANVQ
ncbi:hypothetical protein Poli38472_012987 [Pythium oligandrum]|uniref:Thioredoxin domain-containing protein n=1 Tax=Pythium oligandrum TaxID=41045 RepID=A0A8K1FHX3_PYTOL|nr:hypothetical protein Poli38472_012987 [Pythium oligandrum]|eukprot:TMW64365.1 hypothetical protein Poli38472_012987 [Pythium oligandrum]